MKKNIITLICFLFLFQNGWAQFDIDLEKSSSEYGVGDPYDLPNLLSGLTLGAGAGDVSYSGSGLIGGYADYSQEKFNLFGALCYHWGSPYIDKGDNLSMNEFKSPRTLVLGISIVINDFQKVASTRISRDYWISNANKRKQWLMRASIHNTSNMFSSALLDQADALGSLFSKDYANYSFPDYEDSIYLSRMSVQSVCIGFEHRFFINVQQRRTRDSFSFDFMYSPWINLDDVIIENIPGYADGSYSFLNEDFLTKSKTGIKARFSRVTINRKNTFGSDFFIEGGIIPGLKSVNSYSSSARNFLRIGLTMLFMQKV